MDVVCKKLNRFINQKKLSSKLFKCVRVGVFIAFIFKTFDEVTSILKFNLVNLSCCDKWFDIHILLFIEFELKLVLPYNFFRWVVDNVLVTKSYESNVFFISHLFSLPNVKLRLIIALNSF